jgi:hypothetical protein
VLFDRLPGLHAVLVVGPGATPSCLELAGLAPGLTISLERLPFLVVPVSSRKTSR